MNVDGLMALLRGGKVPPVLVLHGDEDYFSDAAVRLAREAFLGRAEEGFVALDAPRRPGDSEGTPLPDALEDARTLPMFVAKKLVLWRCPALGEADAVLLAKFAAAAPSFSRVIIAAGETGRGTAKKLADAGAVVVECRRLFDTPWPGRPEWDTALNKWTTARAKERGLALDLQTAHRITAIVGNDLSLVDAALSVLAASGARVTEESVRDLLGGSRDYSVFAFGEAVYERNAALAFRIARNLFLEGTEDERGRNRRDAGYVAGRLVWSAQYRLAQVYAAARLLAQGRSPEEAAAALGGKPPAVRAVTQARAFRIEALRRHFPALTEAAAALRTAVPEAAVMDALVVRLTEDAADV